jgi:hypothetical protein
MEHGNYLLSFSSLASYGGTGASVSDQCRGLSGRAIVLGTADTAQQALNQLHEAIGDYPRAWVTDEENMDVSLAELIRLAAEERDNG